MHLFSVLMVLLVAEWTLAAILTAADNDLCKSFMKQFRKNYTEAEYIERFLFLI